MLIFVGVFMPHQRAARALHARAPIADKTTLRLLRHSRGISASLYSLPLAHPEGFPLRLYTVRVGLLRAVSGP